jgi:hypothetical protein
MTHPTANPEPDIAAPNCVFGTITGFLLPFFLATANGNPDITGAVISFACACLMEIMRRLSALVVDTTTSHHLLA